MGSVGNGNQVTQAQTSSWYGALYATGFIQQNSSLQRIALNGWDVYGNIQFNASYSNPIYGNSDTVTPKSTSCMLILKY